MAAGLKSRPPDKNYDFRLTFRPATLDAYLDAMALKIDSDVTAESLQPAVERMFELSAAKLQDIERSWQTDRGTPVFTVCGQYTTRGWTEWTEGFLYGSMLLQFEAAGERRFLDSGRRCTYERMASHVSHVGVHDHGFNNVSTYGNLRRQMLEGVIPEDPQERAFCELGLKVSGAVQAARWTTTAEGGGFIYSFNGPHSLFIDTLRSLRSLALAHHLGHVLMGERDARIDLLHRLEQHVRTTARYAIYYGENRDAYDVRGRVAHESIFNLNDGQYRCPNSQQGYSPFTTWTRGLAWAILGLAEQLEFLRDTPLLPEPRSRPVKAPRRRNAGASVPAEEPLRSLMERALLATADYYLQTACADGIPYWDTGAPNLHRLGDWADRPADPFNDWEPVDSSAAAIAAQGLIRLGYYLQRAGRTRLGRTYRQAGLTVAKTLFAEPYLSLRRRHQGLLLHSVYHRPNGWDHIARGQRVPNGESSMWGDYHARELGLMLLRKAHGWPDLTFYGP
jgi:hypothetical protein